MSLTGKNVLVVEDDDDLRILLERLLVAEGFTVRGVSDGAAALRLVTEYIPDLIVLDLMLPWVNGIEVLKGIRQQPTLANVPVLVTTGTVTSSFDLRYWGHLAVMRKPLDIDAILPTVGELLKSSARRVESK